MTSWQRFLPADNSAIIAAIANAPEDEEGEEEEEAEEDEEVAEEEPGTCCSYGIALSHGKFYETANSPGLNGRLPKRQSMPLECCV